MLNHTPAKKPRRANLLFTAAVLVLALGLLGWQWISSSHQNGAVALLTYGPSQTEQRISLSKNARYDIDTGTYTIHLQVQDGTIAFVDSPCPDHTCESFGRLQEEGQWAACLPAAAMLTIEPNE